MIVTLKFLIGLTLLSLVHGGPPLQIKRERGSALHREMKENKINNFLKLSTEPEQKFRLPKDILKPLEYHVNIIPILNSPPLGYDQWTAPGSVRILILIEETTRQIKLTKDVETIQVTSVEVTQGNLVVNVVNEMYEDGLYVINLGSDLMAGEEYDLFMEFTTQIPLAKMGLYRAKYLDDAGNERWLATTQMSPIGFRRFIPGFDEPYLKANFTINIGRLSTQISLANSQVDQAGVSDPNLIPALPEGYVWDKYKPTVKMSTFIVAIIVCDYGAVFAEENILGKPVGVYGPPHLIQKGGGDLAATSSAKILKFYQNIFGIDYPMHKLYSVAIPAEFYQFSAMENWGLNTYRDNVLLYYPRESLESTRNSLFSVMGHELAHNWYGNLVSPVWWGSVWLKEGFSTYFSFQSVAHEFPEYDSTHQFLYDSVQYAQLVDARATSHPITSEGTQEQVETLSIFDTIAYDKGASLVRMMEGFLGPETLMKGLNNYLNKMQFDSVLENDLFPVLNAAAQEDEKLPPDTNLTTIMETWTLQKGFPLVKVSQAGDSRIYISQERFVNDQSQLKEWDPNELWEIPISIVSESDPNFENNLPRFWIHKNEALVSHQIDPKKWVIVNPGGYGYFRTLYDGPLTNLIQGQLNTNHLLISPATKSQLIDDYFQLVDGGYIGYEMALEMTKFLGQTPQDTDHVFWFPAITVFENLLPILRRTAAKEDFENYLLPKIESELNYLKWDEAKDEHGVKVLLRASLLDWACALESPRCYEMASELVAQWRLSLINSISVNVQAVAYCGAVAFGCEENVAFIHEQYQGSTSDTQKNLLVRALACSQNTEELITLIVNSIVPGKYEKKHVTTIIQNVGKNPAGTNLAVGFVRTNWEKLLAYMDDEAGRSGVVAGNLEIFSEFQYNSQELNDLEEFMIEIKTKNPSYYNATLTRLESSRAQIQKNIQWAQRHLDTVGQWLSQN